MAEVDVRMAGFLLRRFLIIVVVATSIMVSINSTSVLSQMISDCNLDSIFKNHALFDSTPNPVDNVFGEILFGEKFLKQVVYKNCSWCFKENEVNKSCFFDAFCKHRCYLNKRELIEDYVVRKKIDNNWLLLKKPDFVNGTTWYVDDVPGSGPGNPPEDFISIQDAIDNASDGDTIFVYSGIYHENIIVDKSIL